MDITRLKQLAGLTENHDAWVHRHLWFNTQTGAEIDVDEDHTDHMVSSPILYGIPELIEMDPFERMKMAKGWNPEVVRIAAKHHWVRVVLDTKTGLSIQSPSMRDLHLAAKHFCNKYPITKVHLDSEVESWDTESYWYDTLEGDRLEYFLKKGRIPSDLVMEDYDEGDEEDYVFAEQIMPAGTLLYHGTSSEDFEEEHDSLQPPAWFTTSISVAKYFGQKYQNGPRPRLLHYRLMEPKRLLVIRGKQDMWELEEKGVYVDSSEEFAEGVCRLGYDGWIIPDNYPDGDDIMFCCTRAVRYEKTSSF